MADETQDETDWSLTPEQAAEAAAGQRENARLSAGPIVPIVPEPETEESDE